MHGVSESCEKKKKECLCRTLKRIVDAVIPRENLFLHNSNLVLVQKFAEGNRVNRCRVGGVHQNIVLHQEGTGDKTGHSTLRGDHTIGPVHHRGLGIEVNHKFLAGDGRNGEATIADATSEVSVDVLGESIRHRESETTISWLSPASSTTGIESGVRVSRSHVGVHADYWLGSVHNGLHVVMSCKSNKTQRCAVKIT